MTRILFVGDLHAKPGLLPVISRMADAHHVDRIVLLGDIMDDWHASVNTLTGWADMFRQWVWKEHGTRPVTVLIGNHDVPYLLNRDTTEYAQVLQYGTPGYQQAAHRQAHNMLTGLPQGSLHAAWTDGHVVASHAGFTTMWLQRQGVDMGHVTPEACALAVGAPSHAYRHAGRARGGSGVPSPLWADRTELEADHPRGIIQVVGHTPVPTITNSTDGLLWYCDTMSLMPNRLPIGDHSMLLYDDRKTMGGMLQTIYPER